MPSSKGCTPAIASIFARLDEASSTRLIFSRVFLSLDKVALRSVPQIHEHSYYGEPSLYDTMHL